MCVFRNATMLCTPLTLPPRAHRQHFCRVNLKNQLLTHARFKSKPGTALGDAFPNLHDSFVSEKTREGTAPSAPHTRHYNVVTHSLTHSWLHTQAAWTLL